MQITILPQGILAIYEQIVNQLKNARDNFKIGTGNWKKAPVTMAVILLRGIFSLTFCGGLSVLDVIIPLIGMLLLPMLSCLVNLIGKRR